MVIAAIAGLMALPRRSDGPRWSWVAIGMVFFVVGDVVFTLRVFAGEYSFGQPLDALWLVGLVLIALGAWQHPSPRLSGVGRMSWSVAAPLISLTVAVTVLVVGNFETVPTAAVGFATGALIVVVVRTALTFRDLRRLAEAERLARTDPLTGLHNRRSAVEALELLAQDQPIDSHILVMAVDVDDFKRVNDTQGHVAGDAVLRRVAEAVAGSVRPTDIAARFGGDEFMVASAVDDPDPLRVEQAARRISDRIKAAVLAGNGHGVPVDVSIGWAVGGDSGESLEQLLNRADAHMYRQKNGHRDPAKRSDRRHDVR